MPVGRSGGGTSRPHGAGAGGSPSRGPSRSVVVLAGGTSRRMGRDKATVTVDGLPLLARVTAACGELADDRVLVTHRPGAHLQALRTASAAPTPPWRAVPDRRRDGGPLAGIEAGLHAARGGRCLVLACDLPYLEPGPLEALLRRLEAAGPPADEPAVDGPPAAVPPARRARAVVPGGYRPRAVVPVAGGVRQGLCVAVERAAGEVATACLEAGRRKVAVWLDRLDLREVDADELVLEGAQARTVAKSETAKLEGAAGPARESPCWLADVDTPAELRKARRWLSGTGTDDRAGSD